MDDEMNTQRWVLVKDGIVRTYILNDGEPTIDQKAYAIYGDNAPVEIGDEGEWILVTGNQLVGDDWVYQDGAFINPLTKSHVIPSSEFVFLFTAEETRLLWNVPAFAQAALYAASLPEVNLASPTLIGILDQAVALGILNADRPAEIRSGVRPTAV